MDATSVSSDNGFDAALKALEDLETTVAQTREDSAPVAPAAEAPAATAALVEPAPVEAASAPPAATAVLSSGMIGFSDGEETAEPVAPVIPSTADVEGPAAPLPSIASEAPAAAPVPAEPVAAKKEAAPAAAVKAAPVRSGVWGKVAIGLGLCSSAVSAAGLVIAERVIMSAQLVVADARERQQQLEHSNKLIHDLELIRDKQIELLKAQQAQLANAPVGSDELQHRLEVLQQGLVQRDPANTVVRAVNDVQTAQNARLQEFWTKLDRIEAKIGGH